MTKNEAREIKAFKIVLLAFIILRPSLDVLRNIRLTGNLNLLSVATMALAAVCGWAVFKNFGRIGKNTILLNFNILFLIFMAAASLSFFNTANVLLSASQMLRFISLILILNSVWIFFSEEEYKRVIAAVYLSSILPLALGLYQWVFRAGNLVTAGFNRIHGTFVHPNVFSEYLLVLFFLNGFVWFALRPRGFFKIFTAVFGGMVLFQIYLTYCRGVWVALVIGTVVFLGLRFVRKYTTLKLRHIIFAVIAVFLIIGSGIQERWHETFDPDRGSKSSWNFRLVIWENTLDNLDHNLLIGNGIDMHEFDFGVAAHNDYVKTLYENGFIGLFFYMLPLLYLSVIALKKSLGVEEVAAAHAFMIVFVVMIAFLIISFADNIQRSLVVMIYYFLVVGTLLNFNLKGNASAEESS